MAMNISMRCSTCTEVHQARHEVVRVIPASPIHFATPEVYMQMESDADEDSDEDFVRDMDDTSESSNCAEFVPESQSRRGFMLPAPAPFT
ncbi:hypothetical protein PIB30_036940 [Stylosanthes scabra]|uniref:Uncharacterized protein n=1 Tax=Stylosanthes scabra TaxID=79078 RepID=A0ABU6TEB4_9FABA|nr:hypothetical protein [Stylosanthes scabra]